MCFPSFFGGSFWRLRSTLPPDRGNITAPWSLSGVISEKLKLTTLVEREWLMRRTKHTSLVTPSIHSELQTWQHSYLSQELSWNKTNDLYLCLFIPLNPPSSKAVALILFCPAHSYSSKPRPLSPSMSAESSSPNVPSRWHTHINIYIDINQSKNITYFCTTVFDVEAFKYVEKIRTLVLCHTMCPYVAASAQNTQTNHLGNSIYYITGLYCLGELCFVYFT